MWISYEYVQGEYKEDPIEMSEKGIKSVRVVLLTAEKPSEDS